MTTAPENIDQRIKQISYSSILQLHSCPRRFQLDKLRGRKVETLDDSSTSITFAFGHLVGEGIQELFEGKSLDTIIWNQFLKWDADLLQVNEKQVKSFALAVFAVQKFEGLRAAGLLEDYELVYHNGKPAVELSFVIEFPDGFRYRGFVDGVLRHKTTGIVVVLEVKTTAMAVIPDSTYKNSAQAIGYSIVLDSIFPDLSSYEVLYLAYKTKSQEYEIRPYQKSYLARAQWIQELILDIEMIKMYENVGVYPMHGESCNSYFRDCDYFGTCTMSTQYLTVPLDKESLDKELNREYSVRLTLTDLLESQLSKE